MNTPKYYTGVGSRVTPPHIITMMGAIANKLANEGYTLRTGDAQGADKAFSDAANEANVFGGNWLDPVGDTSFCPPNPRVYRACDCTPAAEAISSQFHPAWNRCSPYAKKLHGRNAFQVLGPNLNEPSQFLICWTPDGCKSHSSRNIKTGGTGTAISIAEAYGVWIYNLATKEDYDFWQNELAKDEQPGKHKLKYLYTSHYRYSGPDRTDITVKGQDEMGRYFAPTWDMVMGHKRGTVTDQQYVDLYVPNELNAQTVVGRVPVKAWDWLLSEETRTFVCFCNEPDFCHRNILVNYILQVMGDRIQYCGWRKPV